MTTQYIWPEQANALARSVFLFDVSQQIAVALNFLTRRVNTMKRTVEARPIPQIDPDGQPSILQFPYPA